MSLYMNQQVKDLLDKHFGTDGHPVDKLDIQFFVEENKMELYGILNEELAEYSLN